VIGLLRRYHQGIAADALPARTARRVRNNSGRSWRSDADGVADLVKWLMRSQNYRCAYCQRLIPRNELGLRELDHVLPKAASDPCSSAKAREDDDECRTHTFGYPQFTYEPLNLVVACKLCNARKRSYDPLRMREFPPLLLPQSAQDYAWVHPYFHRYTDHINVSPEWLYREVTWEGRQVINVCKLNQAETLASHHLAEALALQSTGVVDFLTRWVSMQHEMTQLECQVILTDYFSVPGESALELVRLWSDHSLLNAEVHAAVIAESANILRSSPPRYHWTMHVIPLPLWLRLRRAWRRLRGRFPRQSA
jgi:5-methylcytosine-specific restriction endonuclease McrA